jgi:tight adherence protein B
VSLESLGPYIVTFLTVLLLTSMVALIGDRRFRQADARMREAMELTRSADRAADLIAEVERRQQPLSPGAARRQAGQVQRLLRLVSDRLAGEGFGNWLALRLRRADVRLQVAEFVFVTAGLGAVGGVVGWLADRPALSFSLGIGGVVAPFLLLNHRLSQRQRALEGQLADALSLISNSLRSGYSFLQAMDLVAKEMPSPISREFEQVLRETRVNIPVEAALENLVTRARSKDLDLAVTAILTQRQTGGNLSEVLDNITSTIRERFRIGAEIRTLTASGRLSGWVVAGVPVALVVLVSSVNPEFMRPLFTHPIGWAALGVGIVMQLIGLFFISRITSVKF